MARHRSSSRPNGSGFKGRSHKLKEKNNHSLPIKAFAIILAFLIVTIALVWYLT